MDAPNDTPMPDPGDETRSRPRTGETRMSNPMESGMSPPWSCGEKHGEYLIGELLGRGQAGFVYSAVDVVARRRCALKVLCRMSSHDLYRNKLGFRRMAPFRHPCLLRTDRIEVIDGYTVLVMEEIVGKTLNRTVREDLKKLPKAEAYDRLQSLLRDYAYGLMTIHMSNLIHRDLKPTNLMVRQDGGGVIVDYGLVANCDPETDPGGIRPYIAGTPRYFSPEALWEQSYTPAGDVFSLGLVMLDCLHEVSGGKVSLSEMRQGDFDNWVRGEDEEGISDAVSVLADEIPSELRRAVTEMLSVDRISRPTSHQLVSMLRSSDEDPIRMISKQSLYGREQELSEMMDWLLDIYRGGCGRLHVHGVSGSGKTRLLDEVERQMSQHSWAQLFRIKCRPWETRTLHVWDQIADQVAARYSRQDRESIRLDPVSTSTLIDAFPQLRCVIQMVDPAEPPPKRDLDPPAEAVKRLILELKKNGPLVFIVDDAQWADRSSDRLWDLLRAEECPMVGIITSSGSAETRHQMPADQRIELGPLDPDAAYTMLLHAARRSEANINDAGLRELAEYCRFNSFRLSELAEEFRPGGMLHQVESSKDASISNLGDVDRFWKVRFDRLSDDAKLALAFIVTAETAVSMEQLAELTGQSENIDVSVSQLVDQRLVHDDATGEDCLTVVHDRIAAGLIENLTESQRRAAHRAWAKLLTDLNRSREYAARIATHYYAAGDDEEALPFAILAADNADRAYAKAEAARWHERVLSQVAGASRIKHLRDAARCYQEACMPIDASRLYRVLAELSDDPHEEIDYSTRSLRLLLRSGEIERAKPLILALDRKLKVHQESRIGDLFRGHHSRLFRLATQLCFSPQGQDVTLVKPTGDNRAADWNDRRLQYCAAITRPMAMLDFRGMLRSVINGAELAAKHGDIAYRVHFGVLSTIWSAMLARNERMIDKGLGMLTTLRHQVTSSDSRRATAEVWAGIACLEVLAMRWDAVPTGVDVAIKNYALDEQPQRFEVLHTRWMRMWASWHLGHWDSLRIDAEEMVEDANRRSDAYQRLLATSGYGANAFLMLDRVDDSERHRKQNRRMTASGSGLEFADFFQWVHAVQLSLYRGQLRRAAVMVLRMKESIDRSMIRRVALIKTIADALYTLISLHIAQSGADGLLERQIGSRQATRNALRNLQNRNGEFARVLAALLGGIRQRIDGKPRSAMPLFEQARDLASEASLLPYQLAAQDAIDDLRSQPRHSLRLQMADAGVRKPKLLERLYTVAPPKRSV
ncbi:MAG: AAA family ATPase [Planctomycetota bacterium]